MPEVKYTYKKDNLEFLFKKEVELLEKINGYCIENNKSVSIQYSTSTEEVSYTLTITVTNI